MMKSINLNNYVKVKLTPLGVDIFYHQYDELIDEMKQKGVSTIKPQMPKIDENGFTKFKLYHLINLYGPHIGIAKPNVFTDLSLYFDDKDLEG